MNENKTAPNLTDTHSKENVLKRMFDQMTTIWKCF